MLKPEQIPKEALFAFGEALYTNASSDAEAIAAALNAWEGMFETYPQFCMSLGEHRECILLPLPTEASDE